MNSSNWQTNAVLFVLLIALSVLTYTSNKNKASKNQRHALTSLDPKTVSLIRINKNNRQTVLTRQDKEWHITQPIAIKANQFRVGSLLKLLTTTDYAQYPSGNLDLAKYGLSSATLSVDVDATRILFGGTNPINNKRYIRIDNSIYLIEDNFFPLLNSQLGTLIDQKLFSEDAEITAIQTANFSLHKDEDNRWHSSNNASTDAIVKVVANWKNAQAFGVHDYLERKTLEEISIHLNDGSLPLRFLVTDKEPWLIIARPELNIEYHFDALYIDKLLSTDAAAAQNAE